MEPVKMTFWNCLAKYTFILCFFSVHTKPYSTDTHCFVLGFYFPETLLDWKLRKFHRCHLCSYTTMNYVFLRRHIWVHTKEKSFQCNICNKQFTQLQWPLVYIYPQWSNLPQWNTKPNCFQLLSNLNVCSVCYRISILI